MGKDSKIEWTHHTFNPWIGCTKVSDGCKNCYAETLDKRFGRNNWGPNAMRTRTSRAYWDQTFKWNKKAEQEGVRYRVFCASMADVFERHNLPDVNALLDVYRLDLFFVIERTPHLDWLLLTKRPENIMGMVPDSWLKKFPSNVWIGTSVENQEQADNRIRELLKVPASIRFLSIEPLLGPIDLIGSDNQSSALHPYEDDNKINWVIVGGESGHHARPMLPNWVRSLRDQCVSAGVPFFFKQWGEWRPNGGSMCEPGEFSKNVLALPDPYPEFPRNCQLMKKTGKKSAGRSIDGLEWNELPKGGEDAKNV
jgi:protein gp37